MCDPKDIILNAIRVLRSRRVRPSDAKIAWFARREFLQSEETTSETLQELVRIGDIFKVMYKGGTSYRVAPHKLTASHKILKPTGKKKFTPTPTDILRPLLSAIVACDGNATKERIVKELKDSNHNSLVERLDTLLQKELRVGLIGRRILPSPLGGRSIATYFVTKSAPLALIMNKNGIYKNNLSIKVENEQEPQSSVASGTSKKAPEPFEHLHQHLKRLKQEKEGIKEENEISSGSNSPVTNESKFCQELTETPLEENEMSNNQCDEDKPISRRGRPRKPPTIYEDLSIFTVSVAKRGRPPKFGTSGATRGGKPGKRARKVFDPSDGSAKKRCSTSSDNPLGSLVHRCDVCGQYSQNSFEELLVCHRCSSRAHPNCLGYSNELAVKSRQGPWTCMDCKHCAICDMDHSIGTLIFCDECDRAYHMTCHQPPLKEQPHGTWICYACRPHSPGQNVYYDYIPGLPTPRDSPVPDDESRGSAGSWEHSAIDPRIPNASLWTVDNVVSYFIEKGFSEFALVFKEQDIDGTALLMLTRNDVLTGLDIKLGPALKIYKQVRILQTRLPNPPLP